MNFEKYQPSSEEMKNAMESMTEEQKKLTEAHEEGYELGQQRLKEKLESEADTPDTSYQEKTMINGVKIGVGWDNGYEDYTIYFPQIEITPEKREEGIVDQVIRISESPEAAKQVFDNVVRFAQNESDVYKIFEYANDLINRKYRNY